MAKTFTKCLEFDVKFLIGILCCFCLSGCQFLGTIANLGHRVYAIVADDRSTSDDISDVQINMAVRHALGTQKAALMLDVEVTVFEGEVLLTGAVPNAEVLEKIMTAVWSVNGVRKVYNYVRVDESPTLTDTTADAVIATQIKAKMTLTAGINASNYKIIVENGIVYLLGICFSEDEYQNVRAILMTTDGVEKMIFLTRMPIEG